MNKPTVYIQGPNGEEIELVVIVPDPPDGTFTAFLPVGAEWPTDGESWIRICPE